MAADQSMVVRCFCDDLTGLVDDDFHALPPVQRPLGAAAMLRDYLTSHRPRRSNARRSRISYCHAPHRSPPRGNFTFVCACSVPAETFGVCRHLSPILLNELVSGCASHQPCTGRRRRKHFFTHHALGFTLGSFAAAHQTWLCAVRSRDCFLAPASSSSTCFDIPSKATSSRIASATTGVRLSNQSRVAVKTGTICSLAFSTRT